MQGKQAYLPTYYFGLIMDVFRLWFLEFSTILYHSIFKYFDLFYDIKSVLW